MKRKHRDLAALAISVTVFVIQLARGLRLPPGEPGMIPSGEMNEPYAVVFSALLSGVPAYLLIQLLSRVSARFVRSLNYT